MILTRYKLIKALNLNLGWFFKFIKVKKKTFKNLSFADVSMRQHKIFKTFLIIIYFES